MPQFINDPVSSTSNATNTPAVTGEGHGYEGVRGVSHNAHGAVVGINDWTPVGPPGPPSNGSGVFGLNTKGGVGVFGQSPDGIGVWGTSVRSEGVHAETTSPVTAALAAYNLNDRASGAAVYANCKNSEAIHAETLSPGTAAVGAYNLNREGTGAGVYAKTLGSGPAGFFDGNVYVAGELAVKVDIRLENADCAEEFDVLDADTVTPGTVMVVGEDGVLHQSDKAYDTCVAGVISGAGDYRPAIVLDKRSSSATRKPIALLGKVSCKVDADYGAIQVGDLLTTSPAPGHAMKASDSAKVFGAVLGKALRPLKAGRGMIPILVSLQ